MTRQLNEHENSRIIVMGKMIKNEFMKGACNVFQNENIKTNRMLSFPVMGMVFFLL